jgi:hypothetical protein
MLNFSRSTIPGDGIWLGTSRDIRVGSSFHLSLPGTMCGARASTGLRTHNLAVGPVSRFHHPGRYSTLSFKAGSWRGSIIRVRLAVVRSIHPDQRLLNNEGPPRLEELKNRHRLGIHILQACLCGSI